MCYVVFDDLPENVMIHVLLLHVNSVLYCLNMLAHFNLFSRGRDALFAIRVCVIERLDLIFQGKCAYNEKALRIMHIN